MLMVLQVLLNTKDPAVDDGRGILERQPPFSGNSLNRFLSSLRFPSLFFNIL